ncbi:zinc finger protein Rlf [Gadus morhua]|uniref:zinc finger protein Rlf n=1 Tax=Gadus morhua TaxID=8049 RepID=UPI0011B49F43|nr:zinc finger protein Rlf [Gadus morhua]
MAEREGGGVDLEWSSRASDSTDEILVAMETLLATLRAFEDVLRHQEISATSSSEYCDNFCQALMHYAGSRNSVEHGFSLLEVYCLSISCFAAARSHLTAQSDGVALVLKRLALSCFELLLTVPENEIPYEAWVQFHNSVQVAHEILQQFGNMDLQALLQITGEGGAWSNPVLTALLTGQPTAPQDVNAYIALEGECFMEMRVRHLEKIGENAKAVVLAKSCSDCCHVSNQAIFRHCFVSLLCMLLPNEEAITEISKLQCKEVLEITSNLEKDGEADKAFVLCTTFLTQQLQQQSHSRSWELILLWSKQQRKIDPPPESLLERCLQLGAIANTVQHLLYLIRVIRTETKELGLASSVELCVKALQLPKQDDSESRISVLKTVSGLLKDDLEVVRACLLTEFLLGPLPEVFSRLQELHLRPDQKYDQENGLIPNSLRCELLLALKAYWPFDPEFWDWKTLRRHCSGILGLSPEEEEEEEEKHEMVKHVAQEEESVRVASCEQHCSNGGAERRGDKGTHGVTGRHKKNKLLCKICKKSVSGGQMIVHSRRHGDDTSHPCPVCMRAFDNRKDIVSHIKQHIRSFANSRKKLEKDKWPQVSDGDDDIEPGEIKADPSLLSYYKSTKDPDVLHHIVQQSKDEDELITFAYIDSHFELQNRDEYPCPGTNCLKNFKHSKYLYVHLKSDHRGDENVKHFHEMRDRREKCIFCRRHFVSNYHHRKHRKIHYNEHPYMCTVIGCGTQFKTSHELADHKHSHGYQLNFQCQLKGCYVTFSDLGQLYHHEAQHFREAAFTCTSPECKKYYLSKKEFNDHLSTHGITFSEKDFETQRKAKRELFARGDKDTSKGLEQEEEEEDGGGSSSSQCASSWDASSCKGPRGTITSVAVCFDGSKFTCGFERCGMTFSRARDVQRHFKCAHPEHLKLENKDDHHDKERDSKSKSLKVETKQTNEQKGKREPSSPLPLKAEKENNKSSQLNCSETNSTSPCQNDALKDILLGLSKLDLNSVGSSDGPLEPSNVLHLSYCKAIMARSPVVVLQKRPPHMFGDRVKVKRGRVTEEVNLNVGESLATAKPYVCKIYGCDFRTAQSFSLLRHHVIIHSYTMEQAKRFTSIDSFKPFLCQICSKGHKEKINLRLHYIQAHDLSKAAIEKINCTSVRHVKSRAGETSQQLKDVPQVRKRPALSWQQRYQKRKKAVVLRREPRKEVVFDIHPSASEEEEEVEEETEQANGTSNNTSERKEEEQDGSSQVRTTRRHNAKSNLCYILTKFNKPFHCVVKDCNSAFSTQGGLVRHLQLFHHYNRSQLVLDKDPDPAGHADVKKDAVKHEPLSHSDEPQPQFQCRFANCQASYHLKSSLVRHTQQQHCQPPEPLQCSYEGCARVFSHASSLKKHILYTHCEYYDSLVLRLQSTHKKPLVGCQKDSLDGNKEEPQEETPVSELVTPISELVTPVSELVTPVSELVTSLPELVKPASELVTPVFEPVPPVSELVPPVSALMPLAVLTEEAAPSGDTEDEPIKPTRKRKTRRFQPDTMRPQDEALQMCQPKHLRSHYPCMIRNCDSVVKYLNSLHRHYFRVHHIRKTDVEKHGDELLLTFERLEDLTGRKCALPPVAAACTSNGVHRMEYQAEQQGPHVPVSLNFIKSETLDDLDPNLLEPSPGERNVLLRADDFLYTEPGPGGPKEEPALEMQNGNASEERSKHQTTLPLTPAVTVNLSPPSSLRFASDEGPQDSSCSKDGTKSMNESVANPAVRLPLKRKNELSEPCNLPEPLTHLSYKTFDIGTYTPLGFESSFLRFIQEADGMEDELSPIKRKDALRRSCSVKENNQLGVALTRSRRTRSPPLKPQAPAEGLTAEGLMTEEVMTEHQLKSILDRALAGCGGPALEQLQYLRPVVVLDRRLLSASSPLPDLMTPDANN